MADRSRPGRPRGPSARSTIDGGHGRPSSLGQNLCTIRLSRSSPRGLRFASIQRVVNAKVSARPALTRSQRTCRPTNAYPRRRPKRSSKPPAPRPCAASAPRPSRKQRCHRRHRARVLEEGELTVPRPGARCRWRVGAELKRRHVCVRSTMPVPTRCAPAMSPSGTRRPPWPPKPMRRWSRRIRFVGRKARAERRVSRRRKTPKRRIWLGQKGGVAMRFSVGCLVSAPPFGSWFRPGACRRTCASTPQPAVGGDEAIGPSSRARPARVEQRERSARRGRDRFRRGDGDPHARRAPLGQSQRVVARGTTRARFRPSRRPWRRSSAERRRSLALPVRTVTRARGRSNRCRRGLRPSGRRGYAARMLRDFWCGSDAAARGTRR